MVLGLGMATATHSIRKTVSKPCTLQESRNSYSHTSTPCQLSSSASRSSILKIQQAAQQIHSGIQSQSISNPSCLCRCLKYLQIMYSSRSTTGPQNNKKGTAKSACDFWHLRSCQPTGSDGPFLIHTSRICCSGDILEVLQSGTFRRTWII